MSFVKISTRSFHGHARARHRYHSENPIAICELTCLRLLSIQQCRCLYSGSSKRLISATTLAGVIVACQELSVVALSLFLIPLLNRTWAFRSLSAAFRSFHSRGNSWGNIMMLDDARTFSFTDRSPINLAVLFIPASERRDRELPAYSENSETHPVLLCD